MSQQNNGNFYEVTHESVDTRITNATNPISAQLGRICALSADRDNPAS